MQLNAKEYREAGGRIQVWQTFSVKSIDYDEKRNITKLVIIDKSGTTRFELGASRSRTAPKKQDPADVPIPDGVTNSAYWSIVSAYADGKPTKTGGDYRETFIKEYNPTDEQVAKFDHDVQNVKLAQAAK